MIQRITQVNEDTIKVEDTDNGYCSFWRACPAPGKGAVIEEVKLKSPEQHS